LEGAIYGWTGLTIEDVSHMLGPLRWLV
jgi:hypothetical protein